MIAPPERNDRSPPPSEGRLDLVVLGLSITSSWGNGHATNYRGLVRALHERGHRVLFLERDVPWYRAHRDLPEPPWGETRLYQSVDELRDGFGRRVRDADAVVVGSYVPDGVEVGHWVADTADGTSVFYDIDTPITLGKLEEGDREYLEPALVPRYDLYLSFTAGPALTTLERRWGSPAARAFHCLVDPEEYHPRDAEPRWDLGYLGTYSDDRQPMLERLLVEPARRRPDLRFCVAGPQYPDDVDWPDNVDRIEHVPPPEHREFYTAQRFTLNVTRERMARAGWSPSVRLFEAAACGVPVVSDYWPGLDRFFTPGDEILIRASPEGVLGVLDSAGPDEARRIGARARARVLREHTAGRRAEDFEALLAEARALREADGRPGRERSGEGAPARTGAAER